LVVISSNTPNSNCSGTGNGQLDIDIDSGGNPADYTIEWFEGNTMGVPLGTTVGVTGGVNGEQAQQLTAGFYTVRVTDNTNPGIGCASVSIFEVVDDPPVLTITSADITVVPQDDCIPENGSITVSEVRENNVPITVSGGNYSFEWFDASLNPLPVPIPDNQYSGLAAGTYYVRATNTVSGCTTSEVEVEIEDQTALPVVVMNLDQPNISCDLTNPMGVLSITINGSTDLTGYSVDWYIGQNNTTNALPGAQVSGNQAIDLAAGFYTVMVTDNSNPGMGCATISWLEVPDDPMELTLTQPDLVLTHQSNCAPINGGAEVAQVRENGVPVVPTIASHSMEWFDENMNPLPAPGVFNIYPDLNAGLYHVQVTNLVTGCVTAQVPFEILDQTARPQIDLVDFNNTTACDGINVTGELIVTADGSTDTGAYTFTWYNGPFPVSGAPIAANNYQINNLSAGIYTVVVVNTSTGCTDFATYELISETNPLYASASSTGVTNCDLVDGVLFSVVLDSDGLEPSITYDYQWYAGQGVSGAPIYSGQRVENVPVGFYTVVATAVSNPACIIEVDTVEVEDFRIMDFMIDVEIVSPMTNCDVTLPNGVASASVNGDIINYEYTWFEGKDLTVAPLYAGVTYSNLGVGTYTIQARDLVTGCVDSLSFEMAVEYEVIPMPEIGVTDVTSCVTGNGGLHASVGGNIGGFIFNWYSGEDTTGPIVSTGPDLIDLSAGDTYTVTATSRTSGCESGGTTAVVGENLSLPEYELDLGAAVCSLDNGFAKVIDGDSLDASSIVWSTGAIGPEISNITPGRYSVTVTDSLGCSTQKEFEIASEINTFNGVSPNNDGNNDIFHIACIEDFPGNNVKVFNRAGTLVYEADGYNNSDIFFDGLGNRGIYFGAREVPDGTYYYVIDKRDGSNPLAGYLELLR
ncbi:MAG: gliding motility-associated C-terminal domain-containing protein, partial [Cyclobacteriaceae bacterium]